MAVCTLSSDSARTAPAKQTATRERCLGTMLEEAFEADEAKDAKSIRPPKILGRHLIISTKGLNSIYLAR